MSNPGIHKRSRGEWIALILLALGVGNQVFVPPVVGLADSGDFQKVLGIFNLGGGEENEYTFLTLTYDFNPQHHAWREFISTEQAIAGIAIVLSAPFRKLGTFDIRVLGAMHTALYLLAFYLLQPLLRGLRQAARILLNLALIAVFSDVMYVSWMNTAYMDTSALLFLLLTAVLYLRAIAWRRTGDQIGFVISSALFTAAKTEHCALGLALAALLLLSRAAFRSWILRGVGAAVIIAFMLVTWMIMPADYRATGLYSEIFYELLPHSKDLSRDLQELGLDDSYRRRVGTYAYQEGSPFQDPQFQKDFFARVSYQRLGWFLVRHPALAYRGLRDGLDFAGRQRPALGNFARESGAGANQRSQAFTFWSGLKRRALENQGSHFVFFFLGICSGLCAALWWRHRGLLIAGGCLCLMGFLALGISAFADAVDATRHFFLFNALADMILISALAALLARRSVES